MGKYSIKEVEVLSGVKAHTLRIWEQRYKAVVPLRTETNIRYYTDDQVKRVLNLAQLNKSGYKISKLVHLANEEITKLLEEVNGVHGPYDYYINLMITGMIELNETQFQDAMNKALEVYSFHKFCADIVFPFLGKIGLLWTTGGINPAQEHFASNLLRRKVILEIDRISPVIINDPKTFMLFLPEGEFHELSLLMSEYLIKSNGHKVFYFGASLPNADLEKAIDMIKPDYLMTLMLMAGNEDYLEAKLKGIAEKSKDVEVWVAGAKQIFDAIVLPNNFKYISDLGAFKTRITEL